MKVAVQGLWHLGSVTAACLASVGHHVVGLDGNPDTVNGLQAGRPPLFEPGLDALVQQGLRKGRLRFTADADDALAQAEVLWVTYDTPVDEDDRADVDFVFHNVTAVFPHLRAGTIVLVSSQVPVGTTKRLEQAYAAQGSARRVTFACVPENLRLGKAIDAFLRPDRVVVGLRSDDDWGRIEALLGSFTSRVERMSVESAEMTKHALNAFLATSVAFINEVAVLCEEVGADARDVERGLKTDARIGARARLAPGAAFAGGTLARDLVFLAELGRASGREARLMAAVRDSNEAHRQWARHRLRDLLGDLGGRRIALWGLTYKPGTDTLRRSASVELSRWLAAAGAEVHAHDPAVRSLPGDLEGCVTLHDSPLAAVAGASALIVATEWPDYRSLAAEPVVAALDVPLVLDPGSYLQATLGSHPGVRYVTVGRPQA